MAHRNRKSNIDCYNMSNKILNCFKLFITELDKRVKWSTSIKSFEASSPWATKKPRESHSKSTQFISEFKFVHRIVTTSIISNINSTKLSVINVQSSWILEHDDGSVHAMHEVQQTPTRDSTMPKAFGHSLSATELDRDRLEQITGHREVIESPPVSDVSKSVCGWGRSNLGLANGFTRAGSRGMSDVLHWHRLHLHKLH